MRRRLEEHRIRGRVWVALGILAGAGAVYVNGAVETRNEVRELRRAATAQTTTEAPYGGGPQPTVPYATPNVAAEEQAEAPTRKTSTQTEETESPRYATADDAAVSSIATTTVATPADVGDGGVPKEVEDVAAPTDDVGVAEDTGPAEDAMAQVIAAAAEAGVLIDPNVPYVTPIYATPIAAGAEPFPAQSFPEPTGAGGTAATPSVEMAGGTSIGASGAGGIGLSPNVTMAGGTSIGATGAGGGTQGPSVTNAGGTPVGNAGATVLAPSTVPFGATVPFGGIPFATPVSPFMTPVSPFMAPQGFSPFMMNPYSYFIYVPPIGAWGAQ